MSACFRRPCEAIAAGTGGGGSAGLVWGGWREQFREDVWNRGDPGQLVSKVVRALGRRARPRKVLARKGGGK